MSDSAEWRTPDVHDWSSGDWTLQVRGDELADLTYAGRTVLRSVRAVVRDRNWDTAGLVVDRVRASDATLTLHVRSEGLGSSFRGVVRVEARAGRLVVLADLESAHEFATNRTGLVVLHPSEVAGESLRVAHSDGSTRLTSFPRAISPHQPVFDIAALSWRHAGLEVAVAFDGDVFEMEDQRNWSDASFKTYSRPLDLPFPYAVAAGERVRQSVRIDVREVATPGQAAGADVVRLSVARAGARVRFGGRDGAGPFSDRRRACRVRRAGRARPSHAQLAGSARSRCSLGCSPRRPRDSSGRRRLR